MSRQTLVQIAGTLFAVLAALSATAGLCGRFFAAARPYER